MTAKENRNTIEKLHLYHLPQHIAENEFHTKYTQLAYIPLQTRRAVISPGHQRWKPENFSAEVYCTWTSSGLLLAFNIRDREIHNDSDPERLWGGDCMEILLDVRENPAPDYTGNSIHICMAPPLNGNSQRFCVCNNHKLDKKFFYHSTLTNRGWSGHVFVPWSTFPRFKAKAGTEIGLGIQISDDYGRPANKPFFKAQHLIFNRERMPWNARLLPRWVLSEKFEPSAQNDLADVMAVDLPNLIFNGRVDANIIIAEAFKKFVNAIEWVCIIANIKITGNADSDKLCFDLPDGIYGKGVVKLTVYDEQKCVLGVLNLPFERFNGEALQTLQQAVLDFVKKSDLPEMAKHTPEKIAGYFGLLNNYEQLKRMIFLEKTSDMNMLTEEINLRMQLLQNKLLKTENKLFNLLQISANLNAQISVEFPRYHPENKLENDALIKFYCGAVPLARVKVTTGEQCADFQRKWIPAVYSRQVMPTENRDNWLFIFTVGASYSQAYLTDTASLYGISCIDAAVIADNAPAEHAQAVLEYASKNKIPIVSEKSLNYGMRVLYAGRPETTSSISKVFDKIYKLAWVTTGRNDMVLNLGCGMLANIRCISSVGCELIADCMAAGRAFTSQESILLAKAVASELAKRSIKPCPIPAGCELMAADVHCHTIYSDGILTPLGLVAAALYSQMDFLLIADHETAEGVLQLQKDFEIYKFKFPLIAGEECALPDGHFNCYPLTESIPFGLSFDKLLETAHLQDASVQYNHPATYSSRHDLQLNGIAGSGLEGWEHEMPPYAQYWQDLPAQIGSSDNHDSAFPTERTITYVPNITGKKFQNAVKLKQTGILEAAGENFIYAPDMLKGMLLEALQNPEHYLIEPHYRRLKEFLQDSDLAGLFKNLPGAIPEELSI